MNCMCQPVTWRPRTTLMTFLAGLLTISQSTVCSLGEVKKYKPEKYTNTHVLKVWFAYDMTLYWDFWYFENSLVIFFKFQSKVCALPWNSFLPPLPPMDPNGPLCVPMWLHFGTHGPKCQTMVAISAIGTTYGPLCATLRPTRSHRGLYGSLLSHSGHQWA